MFQWNIAIPINLTNQSWRRPYSPMRVVVHPAVMGMLMKWKHLTNLTLIKDWKIRRQNCCSVCSVHWKRRLQLTSEPVTYSHEVRDKKNSMNFFMNSCGTEEKRARARARVSFDNCVCLLCCCEFHRFLPLFSFWWRFTMKDQIHLPKKLRRLGKSDQTD